jgi:hypothetical protein
MTTYVHSTTACFYHLRTVIIYYVIKTGPISLAFAILTCVHHANLFSCWHEMLNTILTFRYRSPKWSHSCRFTIWIFLCISHSHIHTTLISHDTFLQFFTIIHIMLNCYSTCNQLPKRDHMTYEN